MDKLAQAKILRLDCLHRDGCGGVGALKKLASTQMIFETMMTATFMLFLLTFGRSYLILLLTTPLLLFFAVLSGLALWWLTSAFNSERDRQLLDWNEVIRRSIERPGLGTVKTLVAMEYRDSVLKTRLLSWQSVAPVVNAMVLLVSVIVRSLPAANMSAAPAPRPSSTAPAKVQAITLDYRWRAMRMRAFGCPLEISLPRT
jgi:hypothetical protein